MPEQAASESELLIRVDERVENLTRMFQEFTNTHIRDNESMKQEIECERKDRSDADEKLQEDIDWLKSKVNMGFGAIGLVTFGAGLYSIIPK